MSERELIETGIETLLGPLVTAKTLKKVLSVGGEPFEKVLKAALAVRPWAMIKYMGKTASTGGEVSFQRAEISVLIGVGNETGMKGRRHDCFGVLDAVENALLFQEIGAGFGPLEFLGEEWSQVTMGQAEVWVQRYALTFGKG